MKEEQYEQIRSILKEKNLKVTPQRTIILQAFQELKNHPTADLIIEYIRQHHPNIAVGTVYKVLETFTEKGIIKKIKTEQDVMRYDSILEKHHHLYCSETGKIEDYSDPELDELLSDYFKKVNIPGFTIKDIKLNINGKYTTKK